MTLRTLKRKVSAHRFREFDSCLRKLGDAGELAIEPDPATPSRSWVRLTAVGVSGGISGSNQSADTHVIEKTDS
jgi:hypothetical protein